MASHHTGSKMVKVQRFAPHRMAEKGKAKKMNQRMRGRKGTRH